MSNDLISREALKKSFANSEHIKETVSGLDVMEMLAIKEIIDNAPTVDTTEQEEFAYNEGYAHGLERKRPQGKWIYKEFDVESGISHSYWCSNCGEPKSQWCGDFCQRCGAKMQKGGAE